MNSATVTIQSVDSKQGVSQKTGKPWTKYEIHTSGGTFGTFDAAAAEQARNAPGATVAVTYEENQYGRDLKTLMVDPSVPPAAHVEPVRAQTQNGATDWDMIGLRKTRCALWVAAIGAGLNTAEAHAAVLAAEVDIFHRPPANATSDVPF